MTAPPTPPPSKPQAPRSQLGDKLAEISRQRAPVFRGRGWAVAALLLLAAGGMIVQWVRGEAASPLAQSVRDSHAAKTPAQDAAVPSALPDPSGGPVEAPAAAPDTDATVLAGSASDLALAVGRAPAKERPALRLLALTAYGEMVHGAAHRRAALEAAQRLAGETVPEEAALWARLTEGALEALRAPGDAGAAVLYLSLLFDRGGAPGVTALERVVDDERRPLELRVAAARALPTASRATLASRIGSRANAHPALTSALR